VESSLRQRRALYAHKKGQGSSSHGGGCSARLGPSSTGGVTQLAMAPLSGVARIWVWRRRRLCRWVRAPAAGMYEQLQQEEEEDTMCA
jgi:MYXO-CTERM domain-containing protein